MFRSFFFLDNYGLGDNLKINLSLCLQVHPGALLGSTDSVRGSRWNVQAVLSVVTGVFQDSGAGVGLLPPLAWSSCWELREGLAIAWGEQPGAPEVLSGSTWEGTYICPCGHIDVTPGYWWVLQGLCPFQTLLCIPLPWEPPCHLWIHLWAGEGSILWMQVGGQFHICTVRAESRLELTLRIFWILVTHN